MATIYSTNGERIADATLELPVNGRTAQLRNLPRSNGLLAYYFGQGGRRVYVDTPDGRMEGRLNTRWERFGRAWEIVLMIPSPRELPSESDWTMDEEGGQEMAEKGRQVRRSPE